MSIFSVTIPDEAWEEVNEGLETPRNSLITTLVVNGLPMHLEAWRVEVVGDIQGAADSEYHDCFEQLHAAVNADGHFNTTTISGGEYILVATPHC